MTRGLRWVVGGVAAAALWPLASAVALHVPASVPSAHAAVSIEMTLDELVAHSTTVVLAEPTERSSRWEQLGGSRRIVTYTRLEVGEALAGDGPSVVWVRTLGGVVDGIGQHVSGEASFELGKRTLVFIGHAPAEGDRGRAAAIVTGMGQGQFRVTTEAGAEHVIPGADRGTVLPRRGPSIAAREQLVGRLTLARQAIAEAWKRKAAHK